MLALLDRLAAMINADPELSKSAKLGKDPPRVTDKFPIPEVSVRPLLVLALRMNRVRGEDVSTPGIVSGWLMCDRGSAPNGAVHAWLDEIYHDQAAGTGIRALFHNKSVDICDPTSGVIIWTFEEIFKSDSLVEVAETGDLSMHFQFSTLIAPG